MKIKKTVRKNNSEVVFSDLKIGDFFTDREKTSLFIKVSGKEYLLLGYDTVFEMRPMGNDYSLTLYKCDVDIEWWEA